MLAVDWLTRYGQGRCPQFTQLLDHHQWKYSPLLRKQAVKHWRNCEVCEELRRDLVKTRNLPELLPFPPPRDRQRQQTLDRIELTAATGAAAAGSAAAGSGVRRRAQLLHDRLTARRDGAGAASPRRCISVERDAPPSPALRRSPPSGC